MADVLSQSQIDALLKSMKKPKQAAPAGQPAAAAAPAGKPPAEAAQTPKKQGRHYKAYDFYSPRKFTKEKIKILNSAFENYARVLTSQINGIFRVMTDITVLEVQERRYYEYVNAFHENDCMTLVDTFMPDNKKQNVPLMIYISPGLVITLINHMLGGGDEVIKVPAGYRYSDVETALYRRVAEYVMGALKDGFSNYINLNFKLQRVEENPTMAQEVGLDETVAIILLNVDVSGVSKEQIKVCVPGTLLEVIFHVIDTRKHLARGYSYEDNREEILDDIRSTSLPVTGQLGTIRLELEELYRIQPGDVIDMGLTRDSPVRLFVGRQPWFTGKMGQYRNNVAVQILSRLPEKTNGEGGGREEAPDSAEADASAHAPGTLTERADGQAGQPDGLPRRPEEPAGQSGRTAEAAAPSEPAEQPAGQTAGTGAPQ